MTGERQTTLSFAKRRRELEALCLREGLWMIWFRLVLIRLDYSVPELPCEHRRRDIAWSAPESDARAEISPVER